MSEFQVILKVSGKPDQTVTVDDSADTDGAATLTQEELDQILFQAGSDAARTTFVINGAEHGLAALRSLVRGGGSPPSPPPPTDDTIGWGWGFVPTVTSGLSLVVDKLFYDDMVSLPGNRLDLIDGKAQPVTLFLFRTAFDAGTTVSYTRFQPGMKWEGALAWDLIFGVSGAVSLGVSFAVEDGEDPWMHLALRHFTDIGAARVHRHGGRLAGGLTQLGLAAVFIPVGIWGCEGRDPVTPEQRYAGSDTTDFYGVSGNPYEGNRFPNICTNLIATGATHGIDGAIHMIQFAFGNKGPGVPVAVSTLPGGPGGPPVAGGYVSVDLSRFVFGRGF